MASFRTHFSSGIVIGVIGIFGALMFSFANGAGFFAALFVVAVTGAIAPDMDSDSGVPFHAVFGSLSAIAASIALWYAFREYPGDIRWIIGFPVASFVVVWGIVGNIFKHFTRHRGMAHSLPAALAAGLVIFFLAGKIGFDEWKSFLLGVAMSAGYLAHLILDEVYAAVNFHGTPFVPNKAFGSALKLTSHDRGITFALYAFLLFLLAGNFARFELLTIRFITFFQG